MKPLPVKDEYNENNNNEAVNLKDNEIKVKVELNEIKVKEEPQTEHDTANEITECAPEINPNVENENEIVDKVIEMTNEEKAKETIHSRKFRSYCNHILSPEMDTMVSTLMSDLIRFQDKQHAKDPVKAKARKRFVVGLREVAKFLKVKKVKCIVLAPDLERVETEGGLDDAVDKLVREAG